MGRPVAGLVLSLVLLAPLAAAQTLSDQQDDARDDVVGSLYGSQPELPHLDILSLEGIYDDGTLEATTTLVAPPPEIPQNRSVDHLLLIDHQEGRGPFGFGDWDTQVRCRLMNGTLDEADCEVTGNATVLSVALDDTSVHWRITGLPADRLELGAGSTQAANDGQSVVDGFDFTENADPFASFRDVEQDAPDETPAKPWWQSGWILLLAVAAGVTFAVWRNRRKRT